MNAKAIWITLLVLVLAVGSYFGYEYYFKKENVELWALVPASAIGVYQTGTCDACVDSVRNFALGQLVSDLFTKGKSTDTAYTNLLKTLIASTRLISAHKVNKNDVDFLFLGSKTSAPITGNGLGIRQRLYEGLTIYEANRSGNSVAWVQIDEFQLVSKSSILVEDGIRTFKLKTGNSFRGASQSIRSMPTVKSDGGDLVLSLRELSAGLSIFTRTQLDLGKIGSWTILDVKRSGESLTMNGFTEVDSVDRGSLLALFEGQSPVPFEFKNIISNNAQYVIDFGFTDAAAFGERLNRRAPKQSIVGATDRETLYSGMAQELAVVGLEAGSRNSSTICLVGIKGSSQWMEVLNKLAAATATDTLFQEPYSDFLISRIQGDLIGALFPVFGKSFNETFYVRVGDAVALSDDLRAIKKLLEDIEEEEVWSKSVERNKFLGSTLLESNVNLFFDPQKMQGVLQAKLAEQWTDFLKKQGFSTRFGLGAVQFSRLNENFYTNVFLTATPSAGDATDRSARVGKEVLVNFASGLATQAFAVKNHNDKSWEVVIQDSSKNLYMLDKQGKVLWQKQLDGIIRGPVLQVDYFLNGKLQLLMATEKTLYLIDRLGNYVSGFPKTMPFVIDMINVIDYDHSRKYRYILADRRGTVRMTDKEGTILEGWEGLKAGEELLTAPRHYRIGGRDYLALVRKDGLFSLYNRRGEINPSFPVNLKSRPRDNYFVAQDDNQEKPHVVFVNTDGLRIKVKLDGEEISRETLIKPTVDTYFRLVCERDEKFYVIVRQSSKGLSILNAALEEVMTNDFVGVNNTIVNVYDVGSGSVYYTVVDANQDLGYVYDSEGNLLNAQPIECQYLTLAFDRGRTTLISVFENRVQLLPLQ